MESVIELMLKEIVLGIFVFIVLLGNISNVMWCIKYYFNTDHTFMDVALKLLELLIYLTGSILGVIVFYTLLFC